MTPPTDAQIEAQLFDALNGLLGLTRLLLSRDDLPRGARAALEDSWRVRDAYAAILAYERSKKEP